MKISYSIKIFRPPEVVFSWIENPERAMQWQKNVQGGEIFAETAERIGTTFAEILEEDGQRLEMRGTITRFEWNREIGFHLVSKIHELDVLFSLDEQNGNTLYSVDADIRWKFPMNILGFFLQKSMAEDLTRQFELEARELKRICETS
ncbi:MAG: SRPBCC family protein [Anaerolineales bacterium]|nr:SRPBCC family protein [Anaerolineales bacterium]